MKKRWIFWWIGNIFWLILFVIGTAVIWLREMDGAGVPQTPELKLLAFFILLIAFAFPILIQGVWSIINLGVGRNREQ